MPFKTDVLTVDQIILGIDASMRDTMGRLRVGEPECLFEVTSVFGKSSMIMDEEIFPDPNTGSRIATSVAKVLPESYVEMAVKSDGALKSLVARKSYEYIPYQAGKSREMGFTVVLQEAITPDVISRVGCFDEDNGLFFELNDGVMYVVERLGGVDTAVPQSAWNVDRMDGTGKNNVNASGLTMTATDFGTSMRLFGIRQS